MFEYRLLNPKVKYQQQWITQGYTVAFTIDWNDYVKTMTIAQYREKHLTIINTQESLKTQMKEAVWLFRRRRTSKNKIRYWFLFKNDFHLVTAIVYANILLVNDK